MARNISSTKNFDFTRMDTQFPGYNSANDPSKIDPSIMVGGSVNVYKKINGNLANRPGKKLYSPADTTSAPVTSEYVWNKSNGNKYIVQVADGKLRALIDGVWVDLLTGLTKSRWVFDKWYSQTINGDFLIGVDGSSHIYDWSGGVTTITEVNTTSVRIAGSTGLSSVVTASGTVIATKIIPYLNSFTSTAFAGSLVGKINPSNGDTLLFNIEGSDILVTFVTTIGATAGNVLIGATIADTLTNLVGLLNSPGTTNATQVALSGADQARWGTNMSTSSAAQVFINTGNTWVQDGFAGLGTSYGSPDIIVNGTTYTASGDYTIFTNAYTITSPSVAGVSVPAQAIQGVKDSGSLAYFWGTFVPDFVKVIENQAYYGSYTSQLCYVSASVNPVNLTAVTTPVQGSSNLIIFDGPLDGITQKNGKPYVSVGGDKWGIVNYTYSVISTNNVRQTNIEYTPTSSGSGAFAHEFIDQVGDSIVYLSQDQQVRTFGSFNTSFTSNNYPSLSQEIYTELQNDTFSNDTYTGNLRCIGDYIYLTSPISGLTYLYQARQAVNANNQVIVERLWHAPMTWNLTRVDAIGNTVIGFSNINPQIYELWDTDIYHDEDPSGDTFPYVSTLRFAYDGQKRRQGLWSFDKVFTEGFIDPDTTLNLTNSYNHNGLESSQTQTVNSPENNAYLFLSEPSSLGDESFGESSFGMGGDDTETDYVKFKTINQFSLVNTFEWQLEYQSTEIDSRWEILAKGTNANVEPEQDSTFIINQQ